MPVEVVARHLAALRRAYERVTGRSLVGLVRCVVVNYSVIVEVTLREGIADPEGATIERALPALGFHRRDAVRAGKSFRFDDRGRDDEAARPREAQALAERLLSNPVIEDATRASSRRGAGRDAHRRRRLSRFELRVRRR